MAQTISLPSLDQLKQALVIAEKIQRLQTDLATVIRSSTPPAPGRRGRPSSNGPLDINAFLAAATRAVATVTTKATGKRGRKPAEEAPKRGRAPAAHRRARTKSMPNRQAASARCLRKAVAASLKRRKNAGLRSPLPKNPPVRKRAPRPFISLTPRSMSLPRASTFFVSPTPAPDAISKLDPLLCQTHSTMKVYGAM